MTTKKKPPPASRTRTAPAIQPSAFHRLQTLLHTMRCITQHEDALCELAHDVQRTGLITPETSEELREIVNSIPSHEFMDDLDSVSGLLSTAVAPKQSASKSTRKRNPPRRKTQKKRKSSK